MTFLLDAQRGAEVLDILLDRYEIGVHPYNLKSSMLEVLKFPNRLERGGEDEARFWFFCCQLMRGGTNSDVALRAMSAMYDEQMRRGGLWPFRPQRAAKLDSHTMSGLLKDAGTAVYRYGRDWISAAEILNRQYDGQVMSLLEGVGSYDEALDRLRRRQGLGFHGFQYKMVSMLLFFLTETEVIDYFPYPPPVDVHLKRVMIETGSVWREDDSDVICGRDRDHRELETLLRDFFLDEIIRRGIRSNTLADALWLHSRMMCRHNPGTRTTIEGPRQGRKTKLVTHPPDWSTKRDQMKFSRSCGVCGIASYCGWNVPARTLYINGTLERRGRRQGSPQMRLDTGVETLPRPVERAPSKTKTPKPKADQLTLIA